MPATPTSDTPTHDTATADTPTRAPHHHTTSSAPTPAAGHSIDPTGRWIQRVAQAGMIAPAAFFAVMTLLGLITPGYNSLARYGSELSLGPLGWIMITNFTALGVAELALAFALSRTITDRVSGWVATAAVALIGTAFVAAGVFVTDPAHLVSGAQSVHGMVHALMAVVIFFIATPIAGLAMTRRYRHQRGFAGYCALTAVGTPALLVATFLSGDLVGLTERIVIAFVLVWLTVLAHRLYRDSFRRHQPTEPKSGVPARAVDR